MSCAGDYLLQLDASRERGSEWKARAEAAEKRVAEFETFYNSKLGAIGVLETRIAELESQLAAEKDVTAIIAARDKRIAELETKIVHMAKEDEIVAAANRVGFESEREAKAVWLERANALSDDCGRLNTENASLRGELFTLRRRAEDAERKLAKGAKR